MLQKAEEAFKEKEKEKEKSTKQTKPTNKNKAEAENGWQLKETAQRAAAPDTFSNYLL